MTKISTDLNPGGNYSAGVGFFHRGGGRCPSDPKPWAIAKTGIVQGNRIAQRYANRQDADDALRFLNRVTPIGQSFEVVFDPEVSNED